MKKTFFIIFIFIFSSKIICQDIDKPINNIALNVGWSKVFLIDEFISPNEYSGSSIIYGLTWGDVNSKRILQIDVSFNKFNNLFNNLSEATNSIFSLVYRHTFFISESKLLNKQFGFYMGPGLSLFFSDREQKYINMNSQIGFGSVDLNAGVYLQLAENFSISSQLLFSVIMLASKDHNQQNNVTSSASEILTVFSFQNIMYDILFKYDITSFLITKAAYRFSFKHTDNWDYFRMQSDEIYLQLGISF